MDLKLPKIELNRSNNNNNRRTPERSDFNDEAVQATNDEAATAKLSAVRIGYFKDEALELMLGNVELPFRSPLMLRGYYSRVSAIRDLVTKFLNNCKEFQQQEQQIVVLGAGFDTLFFHLQKNSLIGEGTRYYEIDFPNVLKEKIRLINSFPSLLEQIENKENNINRENKIEIDPVNITLHSNNYHLIPSDLRNLSYFTEQLTTYGLKQNVPTLFISECVLIYLDPAHSTPIIEWAQKTLDTAFFVTYEQIKPHDPFGQVMVRNLELRGCPLKSLLTYPDEKSQIDRFQSAGWEFVECHNMNKIYNNYLEKEDKRRMERLQIFDEFEEWILMHDHYCITFAKNDKTQTPAWTSVTFM